MYYILTYFSNSFYFTYIYMSAKYLTDTGYYICLSPKRKIRSLNCISFKDVKLDQNTQKCNGNIVFSRILSTSQNIHVTRLFLLVDYRSRANVPKCNSHIYSQYACLIGRRRLLSECEIDSRKWCSSVPGPHRDSRFPIVSASDVEHAAE